MNERPIQLRKNYQVPTYFIDNTQLTFELQEKQALITAVMNFKRNAKSTSQDKDLILQGQGLELLSVKMNDKPLLAHQYKIRTEELILLNVPKKFQLEIKTSVRHKENTALMGLYESHGITCTQCEPEGFRRMTYYLDRPDVLSCFTVTIIAHKRSYPLLLSNGNLVDSGELSDGLHWVKWQDPYPKPCYLFALVAGDLEFIEDYFTTSSGRRVTLRIFCEKGYTDKCYFAMSSLKKAMKWDEDCYGREYDLDTFMIVAIHDFNFGAMENKGLNIFNAKNIFADPQTASDSDYNHIDAVIAHEYFHNWSGNRVTCRDWFQLSLKEGLTVFREENFSEAINSAAIERIDQVEFLRATQFLEDDGPLAHPVRPDSYLEINNFYTATIYEKGAEVIRMLRTLLGPAVFRKGLDHYFKKLDGQAVTCDDFLEVMETVSHQDLTQFQLWYSQAGTPHLFVATKYDAENKKLYLTINQECPATPGQLEKQPFYIPFKIGLLNKQGQEVLLRLENSNLRPELSLTIPVTQEEQTFVFVDVKDKPVPSLLRDFSAPIKLHYSYRDEELAFLMTYDNNAFARWEAATCYAKRMILSLLNIRQMTTTLELPQPFLQAFQGLLRDEITDKALLARMLDLPSEIYLTEDMTTIDVEGIYWARENVRHQLAIHGQDNWLKVFERNCFNRPYEYSVSEVARRNLKDVCLHYLMLLATPQIYELAVREYYAADNTTDRLSVLRALTHVDCAERDKLMQEFFLLCRGHATVLDKWFSLQAISTLPDVIDRVQSLLSHPLFNMKNPSRVRSLLGTFAYQNFLRFHDPSGKGYRLIGDAVIMLDKINPLVAVHLAEAFSRWRKFDEHRQKLMKAELIRMNEEPSISKELYEIVMKSLRPVDA